MTTLACVATSAATATSRGLPDGTWPRTNNLRAQDRTDFLAARQLTVALATCVGGRTWTAQDIRQSCASCGGSDHGRPWLPGLAVSWSHSAGVVAAMVSDDGPVAIDVHSDSDGWLVRDVLPEARRAPDRHPVEEWAVRECLVKLGLVSLSDALRLDDDALDRWGERSWRTWYEPQMNSFVAIATFRHPIEKVKIVDLSTQFG